MGGARAAPTFALSAPPEMKQKPPGHTLVAVRGRRQEKVLWWYFGVESVDMFVVSLILSSLLCQLHGSLGPGDAPPLKDNAGSSHWNGPGSSARPSWKRGLPGSSELLRGPGTCTREGDQMGWDQSLTSNKDSGFMYVL